jgi:hypothetical protein
MTRIFLRRGTASDLSTVVLATGEAAYATDTKTLKLGDGSNNFATLSGLTAGAGGGVSAFTALSDTPSNFSGAASKFVKVNSSANALEFVVGSGGGGSTTFAGLTDTPANFSSAGGKFVKVNSGATALEFVASSSGGSGISEVVEDTDPQLGGDLDLNSKNITGAGNIIVTGSGSFAQNITASGFVKSGGTSSQFLKGDGSVDSTTYLSSHPTIANAASSSDNSGRTYIQDIILDSHGHVTGVATATETVTDTNTTYTAGSGLELSGTTFNATLVSNTVVAGSGSNAVANIVTISSGNYAALSSKNANTLYFIT